MSAVFAVLSASQGSLDTKYYKQQAQELVKQGVNANNQQKAIETLLAIQSEYPAPMAHTFSKWFWFFIIGGILVCLILTFPPKLVLGLGRGEDKIGYWRTWTRIVFVIVPGLIATNFLWPFLSDALKRFASR